MLNILNCVAGVVLLIDAFAHIYLVFHLTTEKFLEITPFLKFSTIAVYLLIILWLKRIVRQK